MKNIIAFLLFTFTFSLQAQTNQKSKRERLSVEQQTELTVKSLTLKLDLTKQQQQQIKPLITERIAARKKFAKRKRNSANNGKKLSADQKYALKNKMLDNQIAYKKEMKRILNDKQYERFEKMAARKKHKAKKKLKKRKKELKK